MDIAAAHWYDTLLHIGMDKAYGQHCCTLRMDITAAHCVWTKHMDSTANTGMIKHHCCTLVWTKHMDITAAHWYDKTSLLHTGMDKAAATKQAKASEQSGGSTNNTHSHTQYSPN